MSHSTFQKLIVKPQQLANTVPPLPVPRWLVLIAYLYCTFRDPQHPTFPISDVINCLIFIGDGIPAASNDIGFLYDSILMDNAVIKIYIGALSHKLVGKMPHSGQFRYPFIVIDGINQVWWCCPLLATLSIKLLFP